MPPTRELPLLVKDEQEETIKYARTASSLYRYVEGHKSPLTRSSHTQYSAKSACILAAFRSDRIFYAATHFRPTLLRNNHNQAAASSVHIHLVTITFVPQQTIN